MVYTSAPKVVPPMKRISLQLPLDLVEALNKATVKMGRPSVSDTARVILRRVLIERPEEIVEMNRINAAKATRAAATKRRAIKRKKLLREEMKAMPGAHW